MQATYGLRPGCRPMRLPSQTHFWLAGRPLSEDVCPGCSGSYSNRRVQCKLKHISDRARSPGGSTRSLSDSSLQCVCSSSTSPSGKADRPQCSRCSSLPVVLLLRQSTSIATFQRFGGRFVPERPECPTSSGCI